MRINYRRDRALRVSTVRAHKIEDNGDRRMASILRHLSVADAHSARRSDQATQTVGGTRG